MTVLMQFDYDYNFPTPLKQNSQIQFFDVQVKKYPDLRLGTYLTFGSSLSKLLLHFRPSAFQYNSNISNHMVGEGNDNQLQYS